MDQGSPLEHPPQTHAWHALEIDEVLSELNVSREGLSHEDVKDRLKRYGHNELPAEEKPIFIIRFFKHFQNILIYILLVAAVMAAVLGEWIDMGVILAVVVINATIGFIQEGKAERAMETIRGMLSTKATVVRDGKRRQIEADKLVPGDIVILGSGDRVPADIRIIEVESGEVDESVLTGESNPVAKHPDPVAADETLGDRKCMAYSSSIVTSGRIRGVVVETGGRAEIGRISEMVSNVVQLKTPLLRKIDKFGHILSIVIVSISVSIFVFGYFFRGLPPVELFMAVVGIAVAAIPEGLPAIMTVTLALGVQRMARRNAIVRKLPAAETLGSVTVICSDKTGTLTRNEMTVTQIALADKRIAVSGIGYTPEGSFSSDGQDITPTELAALTALAKAGIMANEAELYKKDDQWVIEGGPTEGAILVLSAKIGLDAERQKAAVKHLDMIPFESGRRFMASLCKTPDTGNWIYAKGAPERILSMCTAQLTADGTEAINRRYWQTLEEQLASDGHRVLALAQKQVDIDTFEDEQIEDLTLIGLVGIIDPPREEAISAVQLCHNAGVNVKMITGDHVLTARSIAAKMGIGQGLHSAISGKELEAAEGHELIKLVQENDVFARCSPGHKLKIMEALQGLNHVVAMTGDGVNDAPALKRADIGVAMGVKGSEAAKEASDIVLADDNFATIERAIEEGRTIYDNLTKAILFLLPINGAEALVVIASVLFLFDAMAVTPVQILWINMVSAVALALSLAFEPPEKGIMDRPPRPPEKPIIDAFFLWRVILVSVLIGTAAIKLFTRHVDHISIESARTIAVNTIVMCEVFYLFCSRYLERSSFSVAGFLGNKVVLLSIGVLAVLQGLLTYWGPAQAIFGTGSITLTHWLWILAISFVVFCLVELEKAAMRYWKSIRKRTNSTQQK